VGLQQQDLRIDYVRKNKVAEQMTGAENVSVMIDQVITQFRQLTADPMAMLFVGIGFCVFVAVFSLLLFLSGPSRKTTRRKQVPVPRSFGNTRMNRTQATFVD
jgi:hypothetical protein